MQKSWLNNGSRLLDNESFDEYRSITPIDMTHASESFETFEEFYISNSKTQLSEPEQKKAKCCCTIS